MFLIDLWQMYKSWIVKKVYGKMYMKCPQQMDKLFLKWFFVIIDFHLSLRTLTEKFNIPKESVEDMFRKACDLLDLPNSITKIASMDECVRSVQSDGVSPLTVPPSSKNRDLLLCACKTHCLLEVCHHTLASSADIGISFHYILEVAKKLELKKKNKNETPLFSNAWFNSSLKITQKGKKRNNKICSE